MTDPARARAAIAQWRTEDICRGLALSDAARAFLRDTPAAPDWLAALLNAECHRDAVMFLAHALPRARAIRWACDCVTLGAVGGLSAAARLALAAACAWAREPTPSRCEDAARAAGQPELDREGAARFAAYAAAWSGDSLTSPGQPAVAPSPALGAAAVGAAVTLAAVGGEAAPMRERLRDFIGRGMLSAA
jgi:hypothetical protein